VASKSSRERAERTAELLKQQQQQAKRRQAGIVGGIMAVLLIVAVGGGWFLLKSDSQPAKPQDSQYALGVGDESAPVKIIIYEDFLCPACGYVESQTGEQLQAAADAGKVHLEYRPFNFLQTDYSEQAANAFRAVWDQAGPEAAKKFHDAIFAEQPDEGGPFPDTDWFVEKAVAAGADEAKIRPAIENMDYQDWVDAATKDASNVRSTPTVFIDGELVDEAMMGDVVQKILGSIS